MIEVVNVIDRVAPLVDVHFVHVKHAAEVNAYPVALALRHARCVVGHGVIVKHQLGERRRCVGERAYAPVPHRRGAHQRGHEGVRHVVHSRLVERLELHRARLVSLVGCTVVGCHEVGDVFVPERPAVHTVAVGTHQVDGALASCAELAEFGEPGAEFRVQCAVGASVGDGCRDFLNLIELLVEAVGAFVSPRVEGERFGLPRFVTAIARLGVGRVDGKRAVGLCRAWHQGLQPPLPIVDGVVVRYVPSIVGNAVKGKLRRLAMLHRVADKTAKVVFGQGSVEPVDRPLEDDVADVVGHRIVPPVVGRAAYPRVYPVERLAGQIAAHDIARPENFD